MVRTIVGSLLVVGCNGVFGWSVGTLGGDADADGAGDAGGFNGDGLPDRAIANVNSENMGIRLN